MASVHCSRVAVCQLALLVEARLAHTAGGRLAASSSSVASSEMIWVPEPCHLSAIGLPQACVHGDGRADGRGTKSTRKRYLAFFT